MGFGEGVGPGGDSRYQGLGIQREWSVWVYIDQNTAYSRVYLPLGVSIPQDGKDVSLGHRAEVDQVLGKEYSRTGSQQASMEARQTTGLFSIHIGQLPIESDYPAFVHLPSHIPLLFLFQPYHFF